MFYANNANLMRFSSHLQTFREFSVIQCSVENSGSPIMKLKDLCSYRSIVIQCHDNPDPDAVASGFALYRYFSLDPDKQVLLVYAGKYFIQKSNLLMMIERLDIPLFHVETLPEAPELLITVDCQYGEGNVTSLPATCVAVIDHHPRSNHQYNYSEIRSGYGSCASLVFQMLRDEGVDVNLDLSISTALYYGLYSDTNSLSEISHPADKDLRDDLIYNKSLLTALRNANFSAADINIAGEALSLAIFDERHRIGIAEAKPCDPNILGFISDMLLQVDLLDCCLVYCRLPFGIKFSVRSCIREIHAGDMAAFLSEGIGSGGGHTEKAGGFLREDAVQIISECRSDHEFFRDQILSYFDSYDIVYASEFTPDVSVMGLFRKVRLPLGYVRSTDILEEGTLATVRTLEGDLNIRASKDIYIMIGIVGEVYPIKRHTFEKRYVVSDDPFTASFEYEPSIRSSQNHNPIRLLKYARTCIPSGETIIHAMPLERKVKVFTAWDPDNYMRGQPGDFLAVHNDNKKDVYVIAQDIFRRTYAPVE